MSYCLIRLHTYNVYRFEITQEIIGCIVLEFLRKINFYWFMRKIIAYNLIK